MRTCIIIVFTLAAMPCLAQQWVGSAHGDSAVANFVFDGNPINVPLNDFMSYTWYFGDRRNELLVGGDLHVFSVANEAEVTPGEYEFEIHNTPDSPDLDYLETWTERDYHFRLGVAFSDVDALADDPDAAPFELDGDIAVRLWKKNSAEAEYYDPFFFNRQELIWEPPSILDVQWNGRVGTANQPDLMSYTLTIDGPRAYVANTQHEITDLLYAHTATADGVFAHHTFEFAGVDFGTREIEFLAHTIPEPSTCTIFLLAATALLCCSLRHGIDSCSRAFIC